jgi:alkylation response protein AidB-like acyl-CoA dehydrogenase
MLTIDRAQAYTEIQAASYLVYNAARKKEAGEEFILDAAMVRNRYAVTTQLDVDLYLLG